MHLMKSIKLTTFIISFVLSKTSATRGVSHVRFMNLVVSWIFEPVELKLASLGPVQPLVVGHYGEMGLCKKNNMRRVYD